jgi:hypothetical protein
MRHAATGESMPPESRHATRPLTPVGSPPAPGSFPNEYSVSSRSISTWIFSAGLPRSTFQPVADCTMPPIFRSMSTELISCRLSARRAEMRNDGTGGCPWRPSMIAVPRMSRSTPVRPARAKLPMPKTRESRSRTTSMSASGVSSTSNRPLSTRTNVTPASAVASRMLRTRRAVKYGRLPPLRAISL